MTRNEYLAWVKAQNPTIYAKLDKDYEIVPCECKEPYCKNWVTRFTDRYQQKHAVKVKAKPVPVATGASKKPKH